MRTILPRETMELLSSVDQLGETKPDRKLQRDLTRAAHNLAWVRLLDSAHDESDRRVLAHPTRSRRDGVVPTPNRRRLERNKIKSQKSLRP